MLWLALGLSPAARADRLIDQMKAQFAAVTDYRCDLTLNAALPQIAVSDMRLTLYYKRPNRLHLEAREGFALMPQEGLYLGDPVEQMLAAYDLEPLGMATWQGRSCAKYALRPKRDRQSPMGNLRLFVDRKLALPVGFSGKSSQMGDVATVFTFRRLQGKYWLPSTTTLTLKGLPDSGKRRRGKPAARDGRAEVSYSNYRVNTGLPDSLFVPPEKSGSRSRKTH